MFKETIEPFNRLLFTNHNNLKTNISYLRLFIKQIQNHYKFIKLHRNLKFSNKLFFSYGFFYLSKNSKIFHYNIYLIIIKTEFVFVQNAYCTLM